MAAKNNIKSLSELNFSRLAKEREKMIEKAPANPLPVSYPVNELSAALHPDKQHFIIKEVKVWDDNCRTFVFGPDPEHGTEHPAYFKAGAYLSIFLNVDGMPITRPYSISSSPKETLEDKIAITVKRVPNGTASNYILDNWKIGDQVTTSGPLGEFVYLPIRDGSTVVALAGGSGITPFHSLARAIADGDESCSLILLYGSRTEKDILFHDEFDAIQKACDKVKVVHVLSDEEKEGYEHGFLNADLIKKYAPEDDYSIFMCGPAGMYHFLDQELIKLHLEGKWIRHELQGEFMNPEKAPDYPQEKVPETVRITVRICDQVHTIEASTHDSILRSLEKNGIAAPARCRSGECGWCHSRLVSGKIYSPKSMEHRRQADKLFNYIHLCCSFPLSDLTIEVPNAK
ncbi:MAG: iron-sulfur cluster-binding domain-containing protein [Lactimicrobium sp.]|jgi:ferredoxin-NADP reductase|uniref:iron-sulfur cluster-binding domain-containing protein n=1 Tax=Lactimicrobium sp. TaxID=2563780 RepID=UPI002F3608A1